MDSRTFAGWLNPLAWLVLVGGWVLAVIAFFAIGAETCTTVEVPLAGLIEACTDTTAQSVILLVVIGFGATIGSLFLWALRHLLSVLSEIETNTKPRNR
jgi:hypothetical protein